MNQPEKKSERFELRLTLSERDRLLAVAQKKGVSASDFLRQCIRRAK